MKLVSELFSSTIEIKDNEVQSLIIENQRLLYGFIEEFYYQTEGKEGKIILSEDNHEIKISQRVELIQQFIPFEINSKKLLTKLATKLEKELIREDNYMDTMNLLADIENHIDNVTIDFPCSLEYSTLSVAYLVKMLGLRVVSDRIKNIETILEFMKLTREVDSDKLFVLVNMRSYFDDEDMQEFINTVIAHKYQILLIEGNCRKKLVHEHRIVIDKDLCEI
jgi:CRISPR-associated protein Csn2